MFLVESPPIETRSLGHSLPTQVAMPRRRQCGPSPFPFSTMTAPDEQAILYLRREVPEGRKDAGTSVSVNKGRG